MRYSLLLLTFSLLVLSLAQGQVQRIVHQSFPVGDSVEVIDLSLYGDYEAEPWAGNEVLLETQIKLFNATEGILLFFLEEGRYMLETKQEGKGMVLTPKDPERRPLKTSRGDCFEEIKQRLFLPQEFKPVSEGRWQRSPKEQTPAPPPAKNGGQPK